MKKCSHTAHESLTELNITPLLDLAFVLLVIFIITTIPPVKDTDLKLPTASKHPKEAPRKANYISLQADGTMYLNTLQVTMTDLLPKLIGLRTDDPDLNIIVRGDAKTKYKDIRAVLDICQQANIGKVQLATEVEKEMIPQSKPKPKKNSSKVNMTISFGVHALLVAVLVYFAARNGYLGKTLKTMTVSLVKEKPPVKPPEKPKAEPPKAEPPKVVQAPKVEEAPKVAAPPPTVAPPTVAPPATELPAFEFGGGKTVNSESDPVQLYKGYMEYELRNRWNKPDNIADDNFVAEVQVRVDRQGNLSDVTWEKGSGNEKWDDSVRQVFRDVKTIDRPPPTNFPPQVTIRFDMAAEETEPVLQ